MYFELLFRIFNSSLLVQTHLWPMYMMLTWLPSKSTMHSRVFTLDWKCVGKRSVTSMGRSKMRSHGNFPLMNFQDIFNLTDIDEGVPCQPARQVGPNKDLTPGYGVKIRFLISIGPKSKQIIFKKHLWNLLCYNCIACKLYVNIWLTHEEYTLYNTVMMILAFSSFSNDDLVFPIRCFH